MSTDYELNNYAVLTGNLGAEPEVYETDEGRAFVSLTIYTQSSYLDKDANEWVSLPSIPHNVISFKPWVIADLQQFKKGARIKIKGEIQYRPFQVILEDGSTVTKREATIFAERVELAALFSKKKSSNNTSSSTLH